MTEGEKVLRDNGYRFCDHIKHDSYERYDYSGEENIISFYTSINLKEFICYVSSRQDEDEVGLFENDLYALLARIKELNGAE